MTIMILVGALGFLLASVIALFLAPPLWRRAVRVTTKRLNQLSPRMIDEGQADRDQMRAEFAVTTRKMEVKIERLKEESDTQLIELSKVEKKRERLLGKIESQQKAIEKRDSKIEMLDQKIDKLLTGAGKKSEQITVQAERLERQTEMLNAQASTLAENTSELDVRGEKMADFECKEADLSTIISKQDVELRDLKSLHHRDKLSHENNETAHRLDYERLNREVDGGLQEITDLNKNLEIRKLATERLRKEASKNKEKISELIREVRAKNKEIKLLDKKLIATGNAVSSQVKSASLPCEPETVISVEGREEENKKAEKPEQDSKEQASKEQNSKDQDSKDQGSKDNAQPDTIPPALSAAEASKNDSSASDDQSENSVETPNAVSPRTVAKARRPMRIARSSRNNAQPVKTSETPSLAERIRALQSDHPKSM